MKKKKREDEYLNTMSKDPTNWHGPFYVNHKDPRLIVPKYNPARGYTFNFASPYAYVIIVAIVLIMVAASYLK
ncbi:hypothetical protein PbJCM13498_31750 [Prolixibacter bellariivorans]|uniref:DUF5808 domain-containing protein n=1 Tax=Prolixibacter bellariivorans TaxID=314319 RepID=A0A5M4B2H5_9BACT|nr:hypothetical protein [Prolixibacter bellariivorans]GET34312.1 hypothetical protein PbJCM13498_31750 [Prolixibacter bellariivorans]